MGGRTITMDRTAEALKPAPIVMAKGKNTLTLAVAVTAIEGASIASTRVYLSNAESKDNSIEIIEVSG